MPFLADFSGKFRYFSPVFLRVKPIGDMRPELTTLGKLSKRISMGPRHPDSHLAVEHELLAARNFQWEDGRCDVGLV